MKCKHEEEQQHQGRIYYCAMLTIHIAYSFQYIFHKCANSRSLNMDYFVR